MKQIMAKPDRVVNSTSTLSFSQSACLIDATNFFTLMKSKYPISGRKSKTYHYYHKTLLRIKATNKITKEMERKETFFFFFFLS